MNNRALLLALKLPINRKLPDVTERMPDIAGEWYLMWGVYEFLVIANTIQSPNSYKEFYSTTTPGIFSQPSLHLVCIIIMLCY